MALGTLTTPAFAQDLSTGAITLKLLLPDGNLWVERSPLPMNDVPVADAFASVGRGYNPLTGRIGDIVCVERTEPDWQLPKGATVTKTSYDIVTDDKSHQKISSWSAGVSATIKAVSIGVGTSSAQSNMFNGVDQHARIYARIATRGIERRNVRWSDRAHTLLMTNLPEFLHQCGTSYVRAVYAGHLMDETAIFTLQVNATSQENATALSVGMAQIFSVSYR